jgi:hypothetical protein
MIVRRIVTVTRTYNVLAEESFVDQLTDMEMLDTLRVPNHEQPNEFHAVPMHRTKVEIVMDEV